MTIGWDAAGIVEETGAEVTDFRKGDAVFGIPNFPGDGSYAGKYISGSTFYTKHNSTYRNPESF